MIRLTSKKMNQHTKMGDTSKLHICMEAVDAKGDHYYMIHSLNFTDLTTTPPPPQPTLFLEKQFNGYPSMGCGFFDSKIVFAGGRLSDEKLHNGFISFDMSSKHVSFEPYPLMDHGKLNPLVFQLDKNLYVLDTESGYREGAFEYYNSKEQKWHNLHQPRDHCDLKFFPLQHSHGYPSVVIGNICYLTVPLLAFTFIHHPNLIYRCWLAAGGEPLPFSGVATYYNQDGFDDCFIISCTKGFVEAHQLNLYYTDLVNKQLLFKIKPSECDAMCGYFADFGNGIYSLAASDDDFLYVCTFKVEIAKVRPNKRSKLSLKVYTKYRYPINDLSPGFDILGVVGCFAPSPNLPAKDRAEKILHERYKYFGRRYDHNPQVVLFEGEEYPVPEQVGEFDMLLAGTQYICYV